MQPPDRQRARPLARTAGSRETSNASVTMLPDERRNREQAEEMWAGICRDLVTETARTHYERGYHEGALAAVAAVKAAIHGVYRDAELEARRWHLCCRRCRLAGHRHGCTDCDQRDRATFAAPSRGDWRPAVRS